MTQLSEMEFVAEVDRKWGEYLRDGFVSLGHYSPSKSDLDSVGYHHPIYATVRGPFHVPGGNSGWEYRGPEDNHHIARAAGSGSVNNWHQDNSGHPDTLLLWSDHYPTEVMLDSGKVVSGEDGDIVMVDNARCQHRVSRRVHDRSYPYYPRQFMRNSMHGTSGERIDALGSGQTMTRDHLAIWMWELRKRTLAPTPNLAEALS